MSKQSTFAARAALKERVLARRQSTVVTAGKYNWNQVKNHVEPGALTLINKVITLFGGHLVSIDLGDTETENGKVTKEDLELVFQTDLVVLDANENGQLLDLFESLDRYALYVEITFKAVGGSLQGLFTLANDKDMSPGIFKSSPIIAFATGISPVKAPTYMGADTDCLDEE